MFDCLSSVKTKTTTGRPFISCCMLLFRASDLDLFHVNFDLHLFHKEDTPPEIYRSGFHELCSYYDGFHRLYTDGSKIGDQVVSAAVASNSTKTVRLPDRASIFRVELYAITLAMDFICHSKDTKFIVFSDS